jgi:deoxyhypusine synthase
MHPHKPHYDRHARDRPEQGLLRRIGAQDRPAGRSLQPVGGDLLDQAFLSYNAAGCGRGASSSPSEMLATTAPSGWPSAAP